MSGLELLSVALVVLSLCACVVAYFAIEIGTELLDMADKSDKAIEEARKLL